MMTGDSGAPRFCERSHLLAMYPDRPYQRILFEHRNDKKCAGAAYLDESHQCRIAINVTLFRPKIGNLNYPLGRC